MSGGGWGGEREREGRRVEGGGRGGVTEVTFDYTLCHIVPRYAADQTHTCTCTSVVVSTSICYNSDRPGVYFVMTSLGDCYGAGHRLDGVVVAQVKSVFVTQQQRMGDDYMRYDSYMRR